MAVTVPGMHRLLYIYNGFVVFILTAFMCMTQDKIVQSTVARVLLEDAVAVPTSSKIMFYTAIFSFGALIFISWLYRKNEKKIFRYILFAVEIIICMFLLRTLNLSYDGLVLLVVADLMYRYHGNYQEITLLAAMIFLYVIANYNMAIFQTKIISFSAYVSYYNVTTQAIILALRNTLYSINIVLFVFYLVMLIRNTHEEKERIRLLNEQLEEANQRLLAYAIESEQIAETRERNRLAREIHDTLGHALTGIMAGLDACIMTLDIAPEVTKAQLNKIRDAAKKGQSKNFARTTWKNYRFKRR